MIPPKRFDIFPPTGECSEDIDAFSSLTLLVPGLFFYTKINIKLAHESERVQEKYERT